MTAKRGVFWPKNVSEDFIDYRGRTCIVEHTDDLSGECRIKFDGKFMGEGVFASVLLNDVYFQDHPDGYNQPCF